MAESARAQATDPSGEELVARAREFVPRLRFQPKFEVGIGDDFTIISATAPVHYRFKVNANLTPYAGGGVTGAFVNHDRGQGDDDSDFELALKGVGGVEWPLGGSNAFFAELNVGFGDIQDFEVLVGWMFGGAAPSPASP